MKFGKKTEEPVEDDRIGTWADTGYKLSDEEAHRNVVYDGGSPIKRIVGVFINQMKLFSKNKFTFILVFAAILIPVLILGISDLSEFIKNMSASSTGSTAYIGATLSLLPLMIGLFAAILCGTQIPNEFKDRTAYMSMPLPMTRLEFYIGKYLAGFVLCLGVFLMAFGFAVLMAMQEYDAFFSDEIASALLFTVVSIFAYSATAFCVGCFMKRGSALVPMLLMIVILPVIGFAIYANYDVDAALLLPCFLPDAAIMTLGGTPMSLLGTFQTLIDTSVITDNIVTMALIGAVWGIVFLILGALRINRREM